MKPYALLFKSSDKEDEYQKMKMVIIVYLAKINLNLETKENLIANNSEALSKIIVDILGGQYQEKPLLYIKGELAKDTIENNLKLYSINHYSLSFKCNLLKRFIRKFTKIKRNQKNIEW
ncbi:unnamed protein product [Gordionus sp. m RMFG-2023]